ncbi:MAG: hypothetical protein ACLGIN_08735, partial [Candidatus Sericytochromatia bacterium]
MDTRINTTSIPASRNNAPANNVPAANSPTVANNAALNTTDAVSITSAGPIEIEDLGAVVKELEGRIAAMEAQMSYLMGAESKVKDKGSALPPGLNLPPFPGATSTPANNAPANNVPANNAPANNAPVDNAPVDDVPAEEPAVAEEPTANATVAGLRGELLRILESLKGIQAKIQARLEALGRGTADNAAERTALEKQAAGLQTVSHVLKSAKLMGLTPEEEAVVRPALARVHEIGQLVGEGENPN